MKKGILITVVLTLMVFLFAGCSKGSDFTSVSAKEAEKIIKGSKNFIILDVRTHAEYKQGHLKDSVCLPNEEIDETITSFISDKNQMIFVYCRTGRRSREAAKKLSDMGYTNVVEMGGIIDWKGEIVKN